MGDFSLCDAYQAASLVRVHLVRPQAKDIFLETFPPLFRIRVNIKWSSARPYADSDPRGIPDQNHQHPHRKPSPGRSPLPAGQTCRMSDCYL